MIGKRLTLQAHQCRLLLVEWRRRDGLEAGRRGADPRSCYRTIIITPPSPSLHTTLAAVYRVVWHAISTTQADPVVSSGKVPGKLLGSRGIENRSIPVLPSPGLPLPTLRGAARSLAHDSLSPSPPRQVRSRMVLVPDRRCCTHAMLYKGSRWCARKTADGSMRHVKRRVHA